MRQIEAQIMGHGYVLGVPEGGEARVQSAVRRVDAAMCRIRDSGKLKARDRIAVLAALNLAFDLADRDLAASLASKPAVLAQKNVAPAPPVSDRADGASDPRLAALIARLDAALGGNEQSL